LKHQAENRAELNDENKHIDKLALAQKKLEHEYTLAKKDRSMSGKDLA
jgi:hypothetical protein